MGGFSCVFFFRGIVRGSPRNGTGSSGAEFFSGQSEPCCSFCQAAARVLHLDLVWRCLKLEFKWIQTRAPVLKCLEEGLQWSEKAACPKARCPTCPDGPCELLGVILAVPNGISPQWGKRRAYLGLWLSSRSRVSLCSQPGSWL